jgi:hypothetical protein
LCGKLLSSAVSHVSVSITGMNVLTARTSYLIPVLALLFLCKSVYVRVWGGSGIIFSKQISGNNYVQSSKYFS